MSERAQDDAQPERTVLEWEDFCDRMKALGRRIVGDRFPSSEDDRIEGIRHLSRLVRLGLSFFVDHDDPELPMFVRYNDDVTQWGGGNPDNTYLHARVDASSAYRIYGNAGDVSGFIVSVRDGFMHQGDEAVLDLSSDDIETDGEGNFEIIVSPDERPGNWLRMIEGATQVGIRAYFDDWERQTLPVFHIVKLGNEGLAPSKLRGEDLTRRLAEAATWVEDNAVYWNDWLQQRLPFLPVNAISPPMRVAGGSNEVITYAGGRLELREDDALVLTLEPLRADYIGIVYYTQAWFETGDLANRITSLNTNQLHTDSDGRTRIVVSRTDPGHINWIDTERRGNGLLVMRTINGDRLPSVTAELFPRDALRAKLPGDTRWVSDTERRQQVMTRREHIASRFHR